MNMMNLQQAVCTLTCCVAASNAKSIRINFYDNKATIRLQKIVHQIALAKGCKLLMLHIQIHSFYTLYIICRNMFYTRIHAVYFPYSSYQATVQFGGSMLEHRPTDLDLAVLHRVKKTSSRSLKLNHQLKGVKTQVYELEEDMKHL